MTTFEEIEKIVKDHNCPCFQICQCVFIYECPKCKKEQESTGEEILTSPDEGLCDLCFEKAGGCEVRGDKRKSRGD